MHCRVCTFLRSLSNQPTSAAVTNEVSMTSNGAADTTDAFTRSMRTHQLTVASENPSYVPTGSSPNRSRDQQPISTPDSISNGSSSILANFSVDNNKTPPLATISSANTSIDTKSPTSPTRVVVDYQDSYVGRKAVQSLVDKTDASSSRPPSARQLVNQMRAQRQEL